MYGKHRDQGLEARLRPLLIGNPTDEQMAAVALWIVEHRMKTNAGIRILLADFVSACTAIDEAKKRILGLKGSIRVSNLLMQLVAFAAIGQIIPTESDIDETKRFQQSLLGTKADWFYPKVGTLVFAMESLNMTRRMAQGYFQNRSLMGLFARLFNTQAAINLLKQSADELFGGIAELRRYGIKPSYFPHLFNRAAWVYYDASEMETAEGGRWVSKDSLALTLLSPVPSEAAPSMTMSDQSGSAMEYRQIAFQGDAFWHVTRKGEADLSYGYGVLNVRRIFAEAGAEVAYESFRFLHSLRLFDLTAARVTVERIRREGGLRQRFMGAITGTAVPDFAVPRLRVLEKIVEVEGEITQEIEEGIAETKRRQREHRVEYFVRPLPAGCKASKRARERAAAVGITLKPGETFVKAHKRGIGNPPMPDGPRRAKRRR